MNSPKNRYCFSPYSSSLQTQISDTGFRSNTFAVFIFLIDFIKEFDICQVFSSDFCNGALFSFKMYKRMNFFSLREKVALPNNIRRKIGVFVQNTVYFLQNISIPHSLKRENGGFFQLKFAFIYALSSSQFATSYITNGASETRISQVFFAFCASL